MALGGEIASMFVRIRPNLAGFGTETTAAVKMALGQTQAEVASAARANITSANEEVLANQRLATSYREIALAAEKGSAEQRIATKLAIDSTLRANSALGISSTTSAKHAHGLRLALLGTSGAARNVEQDIGKATRGALAGSGVFRGLGRSLAFASGGFLAVASGTQLIHDSLSGAAAVQKAGEAIRANFGAAGATIDRFARGTATSLGISEKAADTTAVRFGLLFRNLGIGTKEAAGMTVGWEKLAGAVSRIKGVDPTQLLNSVALAAAGNMRGLKQMGIFVDATAIKMAALKLGLISNVKDALTPAIKSQALYALATARLPQLLDQARKHSGDFANVQARLSAEFSNVKDALGRALLPTFEKYGGELARYLARVTKSGQIQRQFNTAVHETVSVVKQVASVVATGWKIFTTVTGWLGGTKDAVVLLLAAFAISKLSTIGTKVFEIGKAVRTIGVAARAAAAMFGIASATMDAEAIATSAVIKSALITTGIGAVVVALGLAVAYIITHWDKVKRYTVAVADAIAATWQGLKTVLIGIAEVIGGAMTTYLTAPLRALLKAAGFLGGLFDSVFGTHLSSGLKKASTLLDNISTNLAGNGVRNIRRGFTQMASGATDAFNNALAKHTSPSSQFMHGINAAGTTAGHSLGKKMTDATTTTVKTGIGNVTKALTDGMAKVVASAQTRIQNSVTQAKTNLDNIGQKLSDSINKIMDKLGGVGGAIAGSPQAVAFQKLRALLLGGGGGEDVRRAAEQLSSQMQSATTASDRRTQVKQRIADITNEFNRGSISLKTFNKRIAAELARDHVSYKNAGKVLGVAFADGFRAQVRGIHEQAAAIAAIPAKYRVAGGGGGDAAIKIIKPLEVIRTENQRIADAASRQRERQIKASERAAKAAEKTNNTLATLRATKVGMLPGTTSKKGRDAAKTGVKP